MKQHSFHTRLPNFNHVFSLTLSAAFITVFHASFGALYFRRLTKTKFETVALSKSTSAGHVRSRAIGSVTWRHTNARRWLRTIPLPRQLHMSSMP